MNHRNIKMTEEQIEWLKNNLTVLFKTGSWSSGLSIEVSLGDTKICEDWLSPADLRDAAGIE